MGGDKSHARVLDTYIDLGIKRIELTGVHPHLSNAELEALVKRYQGAGVEFTFHNYFPPPPESIVLNFLAKDPVQKKQSTDLIANAIQMAKRTGVSLYAFHPGYYRNGKALPSGHFEFDPSESSLSPGVAMEIFRTEFLQFYRSFEIDGPGQRHFLALENLFPAADGENTSFMCTFEEIRDLFESPGFKESNIGLLIDLGHLTISANILGFDRERVLHQILDLYGDRLYEVHLSENDGREDLHWRVRRDSWQLSMLPHFKGSGSRIGGTRFCIESRGMKVEEVRDDFRMVQDLMTF